MISSLDKIELIEGYVDVSRTLWHDLAPKVADVEDEKSEQCEAIARREQEDKAVLLVEDDDDAHVL